MGSYDAFLHRYHGFSGNPLLKYFQEVNALYDRSHGGTRYALSQLPVTGKLRRFNDTVRQWEDTYRNTGRDPEYSSSYGSGGIPFVNDLAGLVTKPMKMVNSLAKMYGAEIELNIAKERFQTARQYGHNAELWRSAWEERNKR